MPECERCGTELEAKRGRILDALGLASYDGYECEECGTLLCSACYRKRTIELAGSAHDTCPVCGGQLVKR